MHYPHQDYTREQDPLFGRAVIALALTDGGGGHSKFLCTRPNSIKYIRDIMRGSFVHGNSVLMMMMMLMMRPGVHLM